LDQIIKTIPFLIGGFQDYRVNFEKITKYIRTNTTELGLFRF